MTDAILLRDDEAASLVRMTPRRLVRLARQGKVPCVALPDGEIRFSESDLRMWVEQFRQSATEPGEAAR